MVYGLPENTKAPAEGFRTNGYHRIIAQAGKCLLAAVRLNCELIQVLR
jgi:hypothetical protein